MKHAVIAAVQMASALGHVDENAATMREWIARAADQGASFAFFPEGSLSGYTMQGPRDAAIASRDERALALEAFSTDLGVAVGYGFIECCDLEARPFITYVIAYGEERLVYRKTHLGSQERVSYAAGSDLPVAQVNGVAVGVQLCWEGHIPDIAATLRARGAQLLVAPHAGGLGGARRIEAWSRYLPARALDNGMFVVACNALKQGVHSSGDPHAAPNADAMAGGLAAYDPNGKLMCSYDGADGHMMLVDIGGMLPREGAPEGMAGISYYGRRRPELYA